MSESEIEVKILNIDPEHIKQKLISLGAELIKNEIQTNYIYDFPGDPLNKNYKGYCRIRESKSFVDGSKKYYLTIKKIRSQEEFKEMMECETEISDLQAGRKILSELGLYNKSTNGKKRQSYRLNQVLFELDEWDKDFFPSPYLEVEAPTRELLFEAVELLGFKMEDTTSLTLDELRDELK